MSVSLLCRLQALIEPDTYSVNKTCDALRILVANPNTSSIASAVSTMRGILSRIIEHPQEDKYCRLRKANKTLQRHIIKTPHALGCLKTLGFIAQSTPEGVIYQFDSSIHGDSLPRVCDLLGFFEENLTGFISEAERLRIRGQDGSTIQLLFLADETLQCVRLCLSRLQNLHPASVVLHSVHPYQEYHSDQSSVRALGLAGSMLFIKKEGDMKQTKKDVELQEERRRLAAAKERKLRSDRKAVRDDEAKHREMTLKAFQEAREEKKERERLKHAPFDPNATKNSSGDAPVQNADATEKTDATKKTD